MASETVTAGRHADGKGAWVECGSLSAQCSIGTRRDGSVGLLWSGRYFPRLSDLEALTALVESVLADGGERSIEMAREVAPERVVASPTCPRCGTVCYGDCKAA